MLGLNTKGRPMIARVYPVEGRENTPVKSDHFIDAWVYYRDIGVAELEIRAYRNGMTVLTRECFDEAHREKADELFNACEGDLRKLLDTYIEKTAEIIGTITRIKEVNLEDGDYKVMAKFHKYHKK